MTRKTKAVAYLRVSGLAQAAGDGLPRQRDAIAAFAARAGYAVEAEFCDVVSGTRDLEERTALSELITRLAANGVKTVLIECADRLARDLMVSELILNQLRALGVHVITADTGADLTDDDDPARVFQRQMLASIAQFNKAVTVARLKAARLRKRRETGRCEGILPYGERPGEREAVELMRRLRRKPRGGARLSYAAIAAKLNAEGVATRTGARWHAETVRGILQRSAKIEFRPARLRQAGIEFRP